MTMTPETPIVRRLGALLVGAAAVGAIAACSKTADIVTPATPANNAAFMARYVALGNSITAGFQSDGINDSTQKRAYPALIAKAAGTRYAYAALAGRGCRPPIVDFLQQTRVGGGTASTCDLRTAASINATLNNVAVPGANSYDPTGLAGGGYSALTQFILGGMTQVDKAAQLDPTFATVWIGNNDVLSFALSGTTTGATPLATFVTNYAAMINQLLAKSPNLQKGVLIGVVNVTQVPLAFPAALLFNPQVKAAFDAVAGRPTTILPTCTPTTSSLITFTLTASIRSGAHPPFIGCEKNSIPGTPVGDVAVIDAAEQSFYAQLVGGYNAYIKAKADSIGFAYYDPNPILLQLKANGSIPVFPNLAAPTQPFGPYISNDGVHPGTAAHLKIAQDLVALINQKYGSSIPAPTTNP
jgi:lysophospholipase L1-like esterase